MSEIIICVAFSTVALILSILGLLMGGYALLKQIARDLSTHTVSFQPIEDALKEELGKAPWATTEGALNEQEKLYNKDLKDSGMDQFLPDEEDKEENKPYVF
jgi:hypothetical protein